MAQIKGSEPESKAYEILGTSNSKFLKQMPCQCRLHKQGKQMIIVSIFERFRENLTLLIRNV